MAFDSHCHLDFLFHREEAERAHHGKEKFVIKSFEEFKRKYSSEFSPDFRGCVANFCEPELFMKNEYEEWFKNDVDVW